MQTPRVFTDHRNGPQPSSWIPGQCHRRAAFTVIEMLVAVAVSVILGGVIMVALFSGQGSHVSMEASTQVQEQVYRAFDQMWELEQAGNITPLSTVCANCGIDFQLAVNYASGITWGAFDKNGQQQPGWHVQYNLDTSTGQRQLLRKLKNASGGDPPGETPRVVANFVDPSLTNLFEVTTNLIKIHLQITTPQNSRLPGGGTRTSGPLTTQFHLRNVPPP